MDTRFAAPSPVSGGNPLAALEHSARRIETRQAAGRMIWRAWGGGPPLILLHGGYGSWRHWVRNIAPLAASHTVFAPDIPGLGDSDEAPAPGTPEVIARVVADGIDQLGLAEDAVDLVGFSFGALVAGHVGALKPYLRSLTLVGAGALGLQRANIVLLRTDHDMTVAERRAVHRENLGRLMIADPAAIDELAVDIQEINVGLARVKSRRFAMAGTLADTLRRGNPGALNAIWGERDVVAAPHFDERAQLLRAIRPDVSFHLIPSAGHWAAFEAPEAFNMLLAQLIGRRGA